MNGARFNINKAVSSFVAWVSRFFRKIAVRGSNLIAPTLDIVESAQTVTHYEQILTIRRLG